MKNQIIRIGTRKSPLALYQAELVQNALEKQGYATEIVGINTEGDVDLVTPLYEMGIQGIFTKAADLALLNHKIDIAVHSFKDVPTLLAKGIVVAAVLKRDSPYDILVFKENNIFLEKIDYQAIIATGSIRRKAQWLHRFPNHRIENLRGNVNTRLKKLAESNWDGAIFAAAGLERIGLRPQNSLDLDWMLPAPAQGAIVAVCRPEDAWVMEACSPLNDSMTALCTKIERDFLRTLQGGCSTPIAALAVVEGDQILLKANICSNDGLQKTEIERAVDIENAEDLGIIVAQSLLGH